MSNLFNVLINSQIALGGQYSRVFFNRYGDLRHIRRLRFWPLNKVLVEKYELSEKDANDMADFLLPILDFVPEKRLSAAQCLLHPWISTGPRLLEPASMGCTKTQAEESVVCEKKKRKKKDEKGALLEIRMGNIAIGTDSKPAEDPQSSAVRLGR